MKYTEKYHLPQWVKEDRIMMEDFNRMCTDIEAGLLRGVSGAAEGAAKVQEAADRAQAAAEKAQSTADKAVADAAKAQAKADAAYPPDQPPYAVGTYVGTNQDLTFNLGFRPKFVIISGIASRDVEHHNYLFAGGPEGKAEGYVTFTDTGMTVHKRFVDLSSLPNTFYPDLSAAGRTYCYIAFR